MQDLKNLKEPNKVFSCRFYAATTFSRYLLGWTRPSKFSLLKQVRNSMFRDFWNPVLQDYMVRLDDLKAFLENTHDLFKIYPIWLCPVRNTIDIVPEELVPLVKDALPNTTIVDVGIYG